MDLKTKYWLAGFLEGEGSFMKGTPSSPNMSSVAVTTTDEDVIQKVASLWGVKYHEIREKRRDEKPHWKTAYVIRLRGYKAVELMKSLRPLMGIRRQQQIDKALAAYSGSFFKLTDNIVRKIKYDLRKGKYTQLQIAKKYGICRETVNKINTGKAKKWIDV